MILPTSFQGLWEKCECGSWTLNPKSQREKGLWSSSEAYKIPLHTDQTRTLFSSHSFLFLVLDLMLLLFGSRRRLSPIEQSASSGLKVLLRALFSIASFLTWTCSYVAFFVLQLYIAIIIVPISSTDDMECNFQQFPMRFSNLVASQLPSFLSSADWHDGAASVELGSSLFVIWSMSWMPYCENSVLSMLLVV